MTPSEAAAVRHGLAVVLAAFVVALLRMPQPFLATLAAYLLTGSYAAMLPRARGREMAASVLAIWIGAGSGILLTALFPQQPWIFLPALGGLAAVEVYWGSRSGSWTRLLLLLMGLCGVAAAGIGRPEWALQAGWAHGWNLSIGLGAAVLAGWMVPEGRDVPLGKGGHRLTAATAREGAPCSACLAAGITVALALLVAAIFLPGLGVVLVIASAVMIWGLIQPGAQAALAARFAGMAIGAFLSLAFDSVVAGSGNQLTVFLGAMGLTVVGVLWLATRFPKMGVAWRQAGAMFVVVAPMIPAPDVTLTAAGMRIWAVLLGCGVGIGVYLVSLRRSGEGYLELRDYR